MVKTRFEAFDVSVELISALKPLVGLIIQHDRDLADQIKRAASSVPLNLSEGSRRIGRDRQHSFRIAAGSAAEVRAALAVAKAWGYVGQDSLALAESLLDRVLAMLWRILRFRIGNRYRLPFSGAV